ncbi:MAG: DUF2304 domain-containing protein [Candidatus Eisenbacteria bacterium]
MHPNLPSQAITIGIQPRTRVFVILVGVVILFFILDLVRKKQLREQYALLWILTSVVLCLSAVFIGGVEKLSQMVGIYYPPAFLFLIAILMILVLQFHFSTVISNLRDQNKALIQDVGILASEVKALREKP